MDRKKLLAVGAIVVVALSVAWYWLHSAQNTMQQVSTAKSSSLPQVKADPDLSLLQGQLIIMSDNKGSVSDAKEVFRGLAYVLVQCQDDINASSSSILVDPSKVKPITNMTFFQQLGGKAAGSLTIDQVNNAHLALAYYNVNGWLLVKDINQLNYDSLDYDVNSKTVVLQAPDHDQGKDLYGQLKEYTK